MIQVAYRELWEHSETPLELPIDPPREQAAEIPFARAKPVVAPPAISFSGAPGCFVARDFPLDAQQIVADHLGDPENALAIIDLSSGGSSGDSFSHYVLFTVHGILVRNARKIVSLLWYTDLGDVQFMDRHRYGKLRFWRKLAEKLYGVRRRYSLLIYRRSGALFCTFADEMDDSVKKVVYNFLLHRKSENRS